MMLSCTVPDVVIRLAVLFAGGVLVGMTATALAIPWATAVYACYRAKVKRITRR